MTSPINIVFQVSGIVIVIATLLLLHVYQVNATTTDEEDGSMAYLRDENGERMLNGGIYYIIRRINRQDAGGLTVVPNPNTNTACPLYITQEKDANSNGIPVKISSHINSKYLPFGTTDFTFVGVNTECNEPLVWRVHTDNATGHNYVAAGTNDWNRRPSAFFILMTFNYVEAFLYEINFCDRSVCGRASFVGENGVMGINRDIDVAFHFRKAFNQSSPL